MAVPKQRKTHSKKRMKKHKININFDNVNQCPKCKKPVMSHSICYCKI